MNDITGLLALAAATLIAGIIVAIALIRRYRRNRAAHPEHIPTPRPTTPISRTALNARKTVVTIGLLVQAAAAFKLSFGAQTLLANASGIPIADAWLYPFAVDAAIVTVSLIVVWSETASPLIRFYLYAALALWTTISVAGNALHTLALAQNTVTIDLPIAIAVNTVPALALFLTIHIATTTPIYRRTPQTVTTPPRARKTPTTTPTDTEPRARRSDIPATSIDELMRMADVEGMSTKEIGAVVGRSKSWAADQIAKERKRRVEAAA